MKMLELNPGLIKNYISFIVFLIVLICYTQSQAQVEDDKKKTESMNNEAYQNTVSDPAMQQFFDALKQKYPNVPDNIIWQQVVKMMSRIEGKM